MPRTHTGVAGEPSVAAPTTPDCVAVVVHYRNAASTTACLRSLLAQHPVPDVVVVDNDSPDGSGQELRNGWRDWPGVQFVRSPANGGFGAGCNLGFTHVLRRWPVIEHVLLLNPDAELAPGALAELLATQRRRPRAGIVGCPIDDGHGRTWFANGRIPRWTLAGFHTTAPQDLEYRAEFISGACMLVRGDLLRQGLRFDERYFLYCEDADLCERIRRLGCELWITRRASAVHRSGGSQPGERVLGELTRDRLYWLTRAKVLFAARHLTWPQRWCFYAIATLVKPALGLLRARTTNFLGPYMRGLLAGLRDRHKPHA